MSWVASAGPAAVRAHALGNGVIRLNWFIRTQLREYALSKVKLTLSSATLR